MAYTAKLPNKTDRVIYPLDEEKSNDTVSVPTMVKIVSLVDAKVKVTGKVTGNLYVWDRAGTAQEVDVLDKDDILNKRPGRLS